MVRAAAVCCKGTIQMYATGSHGSEINGSDEKVTPAGTTSAA
ncbi:hypothetical protein NPIL_67281, partial [Nephila pilipes]